MNIFILDEDITQNVKYYVDSHVRKMILETGQLLCTSSHVCNVLGYCPFKLNRNQRNTINDYKSGIPNEKENRKIPYLPVHLNHPCSVWIRSSKSNWDYLESLLSTLNEEYRYRWNNGDHKTFTVLSRLEEPQNLPERGFLDPPLAMPDSCKIGGVVDSYREYYKNHKDHLAEWTRREQPNWFFKKRR